MKDFKDLTKTGQIRRLRATALKALELYDLGDCTISYLCFETNLLFRITTTGGTRYVMRIATPGWRTSEDLRSEALWLKAISEDTTIKAPRIVASRTGEYVLKIETPGSNGSRDVSLMTWLPGRLLGHYITAENIEKMGVLFARLHIHGKQWKPPVGFTDRLFNHYVSRGEPDLLLDGSPMDVCTRRQRSQLKRLHQRVADEYSSLDSDDIRVIHCDLWHDNIKVYRGELYPFDFEDTVWGYRLHDIAMAMLDLLEDFGIDRYRELLPAFKKGYESLLQWPEGDMSALQVGRLLWKVNGMARFQPQWLRQFVDGHEPIFDAFEDSGVLPFRKA